MKKHTLYWYYRVQICKIEGKISDIYTTYAKRSAMSSKNFEFEHLAKEDTKKYRDEIFKIKRKMVNLR